MLAPSATTQYHREASRDASHGRGLTGTAYKTNTDAQRVVIERRPSRPTRLVRGGPRAKSRTGFRPRRTGVRGNKRNPSRSRLVGGRRHNSRLRASGGRIDRRRAAKRSVSAAAGSRDLLLVRASNTVENNGGNDGNSNKHDALAGNRVQHLAPLFPSAISPGRREGEARSRLLSLSLVLFPAP